MKETYYHLFCVRDSVKSIDKVMSSLINQTYQPKEIILVDDGSTDGTTDILDRYEKEYAELVTVKKTNSKTRDYKRIPTLWNLCLKKEYDYHMIGAGDCAYQKDYAEIIMNKLAEDQNLVICSGRYGEVKIDTPRGAGRFVRQSFFFRHYEKYPEIIGYESEIIYRALINKQKIAVFPKASFEHLEQLGHGHNFEEFGKGMKALGFHPLWVIGRTLREFIMNDNIGRKAAWNMFWNYVKFTPQSEGYYSLFPKETRRKIRSLQIQEMKNKIRL